MAKLTAQEFYEKYKRRLTGAIEDIKRGIDRMTVNPAEEAIKKKEKMRKRLMEALDKGKWEDGLRRVDVGEWKETTKELMETRLSSGVEKAERKIVEFAEELLSYQDALKKKIEAMPDITLEDRIRRMETWIREMAKFKRTK